MLAQFWLGAVTCSLWGMKPRVSQLPSKLCPPIWRAFDAGFVSACDIVAHEPMPAQDAALAEGEMAHDDLAAEPAL